MRIALYNLTTTTKHGGVESFVWEIGRELALRGHTIQIFGGRGQVQRSYAGLQIRQYPFIARETWGRVPAFRRSLNLLKLLERLSMAISALPDLRRGRFEIIQLSKPYDFPVAAAVRRGGATRVCYNAQGTDFFAGDRLFRRSIDAAFSCSRYNAQMVEQRYLLPISVAYNGFDAGTFRPIPPEPALRERYAPAGSGLLLYVGRLVTFKGLDHLLDALALLPGPQAPRLMLAGDGPHRAALQRRALELGISERVLFLGPVPNHELPRYHAISDLFVLPSTDHETFGIAACEAMACRRPVIAAHTGGLPEVVRDGETGFLTPPADASALAERIGLLLDDAALRRRLGEQGREWVLSMFTWARVVERVLREYQRALAGGTAPMPAMVE